MSISKMPAKYFIRPISFFLIIFIGNISLLIDHAIHYLNYSDKSIKSDAIVLFVGPDYKARQEEVELLFTKGYANYLLIPTYGKVQEVSPPVFQVRPQTIDTQMNIPDIKREKYFENTHIEVLEAKRLMKRYGLSSAIFVSSPYHMRRIKIITERVFDDKLIRIVFIPTRFERVHKKLLHYTISDWKNLVSEYVKIMWFVAYYTMTDNL